MFSQRKNTAKMIFIDDIIDVDVHNSNTVLSHSSSCRVKLLVAANYYY
jgi:hypothetical protein